MRINYNIVSEASFASRQCVEIIWTKPQDIPLAIPGADVQIEADANRFKVTMDGVATPDSKQSEAYAATTALFYIFSGNPRDEKVGLRLPPAWRDLFSELIESKKDYLDAQDREVVKGLRDLVRARRDQELEDGVILQGAFRGRTNGKSTQNSSENGSQDRARTSGINGDVYRKIWADKSSSPKYQTMIVSGRRRDLAQSLLLMMKQKSRMHLPMWGFRDQVLQTVERNQVVIVCGETGW